MNEQAFLSLEKFESAKEYWLDKFSGELTEAKIHADFPGGGAYRAEKFEQEIPIPVRRQLHHLSNGNDMSLYVILLAALKIMISIVIDGDDTLVAAPVMQNSGQEFNRFVMLRDELLPEMTFKEVLMAVKGTVLEAAKRQFYPIDKLIEYLALDEGFSVFRVMIMLDSIHFQEDPASVGGEFANDVFFAFGCGDGALRLSMVYNARLFSAKTIERLYLAFLMILRQALDDIDLSIGRLECVSDEDRLVLLKQFNDTYHNLAADDTIHGLVERQADRVPGHVALVVKDCFVTYGTLDNDANRLAHGLRRIGVGGNTPVAVMAGRSFEMTVALLAVLKAGGYYLPLDAEYPRARIDYILGDSNTTVLLVQSGLKRILNLDCTVMGISDSTRCEEDSSRLEPKSGPGDLAYLIYTSGTTGKPKGVLVPHRGAVNTLCCRREEYGMREDDVSLQLFSYTFDGFVTSFFTPLASGGRVVIPADEEILDIRILRHAIVKHRVSHFICVPPLFRGIIEYLEADETRSIKTVTLAGDALQPQLLQVTREKNPSIEIANEYGVTEASVMSTILRSQEKREIVSIGAPVWNTAVYILTRHRRLQLPGMPGELCIGGVGVATGYLNNPELTAEKFVPNPFGAGERLYRTGDLARWLPDGTIEFFGRMDHQVKIRGYRIELGEVENRLLGHSDVAAGVVVVKESRNQRSLCAYYVLSAALSGADLRAYMAERLPDYMVPSYFVRLERIPLTPTGKIDRKALPAPEFSGGEDYAPPENETEEQLVGVWSEILEIPPDRIGINDNFFELGGNSLRIIEVNSRLAQVFKKDIPVVILFEHATIASLSRHLQESEADNRLKERQQLEKLNQVEEEVQNTLDIFSNF